MFAASFGLEFGCVWVVTIVFLEFGLWLWARFCGFREDLCLLGFGVGICSVVFGFWLWVRFAVFSDWFVAVIGLLFPGFLSFMWGWYNITSEV